MNVRQPFLAPHAWTLPQIVSFFITTRTRQLRQQRKTLDEVKGEARTRFASYPDLQDFVIAQVERRVAA